MIRSVDQLEVEGKRVFVRVDFNVPLTPEGEIADDTRVKAALPTLKYLLEKGARLVVASHLGRPKGQVDKKYSLMPVAKYLRDILDCDIIFPESSVGDAVQKLSRELKPGSIMLLENVRFHPGETANDEHFSEQLASLADVYVSDAFGALHRAHASTTGMVVHFQEKGAGFLVKKEVDFLSRLTESPDHPFWAIIGGAKVADKIGLIEKLIDRVDGLILGGGLAFTFLKAKGYEIGKSRLEEEKLHIAQRILERAKARDVEILLPIDHRVADEMSPLAMATITDGINIPENKIGLDVGPKTQELFADELKRAKTIFWNGPLGYFENKAFAEGTKAVAEAVAASDAVSVIGGGDCVSAVTSQGLADQITHISTGGGASLSYLEGQELPGLKALEDS